MAELSVSIEDMKAAPERMIDLTTTEMYSIPYETVKDIQLAGLRKRFGDLVGKVAVLGNLAEDQGISHLDEIEHVAPLMFPHSIYKSYPLSVIERNQFDRLTTWMSTLTANDLSHVDASQCGGIDDWLDALDAQSPLRIKHSSGTTGKLSFTPRSFEETEQAAKSWKRGFEGFGDEDDGHVLDGFDEEIQVILVGYRKGALAHPRNMDAAVHWLFGGDQSRVLASNPGRMSADILSLGGRLAAAESRGELGKAQLAPSLLQRRDAFVRDQQEAPQRLQAFFDRISTEYRGKRVVVVGNVPQLFDLAEAGLANGVRGVFAHDSLAQIGGGAKGRTLPDDHQDRIADFLGMAYPRGGYGMSEMCAGAARMCPYGHYHPPINLVPFQLDPKTGAVLPRTGTNTGRFAWVDLAIRTHWNGLVCGDEATLNWGDKEPCGCGRVGPYIYDTIRRYSEKEGGDDKVTCAGALEAHDKALDFIAGVVG